MNEKSTEFFNKFITEFYDGIEADMETVFQKEKLKKMNVSQYQIDGIDYKDNSETPYLETVKYSTAEGLSFYFHNEKVQPQEYLSEEIFHPFSLAVLADKVTGKEKYVKILQNFYAEVEKMTEEFLKEQKTDSFKIEEEYEVMGIGFENGKYKFVEGNCSEIKILEGRIYLAVDGSDVHIAGASASDIAALLNEVL